MNTWLQMGLCLHAFIVIAWVLPAVLNRIAEAIDARQPRRPRLEPAHPCTRPVFSPRIPSRDPDVTHVGSWSLGCSCWSPLVASCKANDTGSTPCQR